VNPTSGVRPLPNGRIHLEIAAVHFHPVFSGAGARFRHYIPGFVQRGIDVQVLAGTPDSTRDAPWQARNDWRQLPHGTFLPPECIDGIQIRRVRLPDQPGLRRDAWFAWRVADICRHRPTRPDVLQLFSIPLTTIPGLWRIQRLGIPTISTQTIMPVVPKNPLKRRLVEGSYDITSRHVTCVVASSEGMSQRLRQIGIRTRIEIIPHGVDLDRYRPVADENQRQEARQRLSIPNDHQVLLFVGSIIPRKGIDLLLEAWLILAERFPRLRLLVVGPRSKVPACDESISHLETLIGRASASRRVHFVGRVDDITPYLHSADIFVFPSRREGMPNAVLEAMASGVPVVTTPFEGFPSEFGQEGKEFVMTTFDPVQIATDVSDLLNASHRRLELARQARSWVVTHHDVQRSMDRYANLYIDLVKESRVAQKGRPASHTARRY
jgi:glycosyltransferase involved in cell wall biosynthesis